MKITRLAIRKGMTTLALMAVVSILGVVSYLGLPRESTPDVKIPYVIVSAPYLGTSPQDMENIVTRKLEKQLKSLDKLKEMTSYSNEGNSTVVLEFTPDVEMSDALQKVRDAVEMAKPDLPQDVKDDLVVRELSADQWPIMRVVLAGDYDPVALKQVAEDLQDRLEQVKGVLSVDLLGGVEREVKVEVDPDRLRFYGLGLKDVRDAIADENITLPGGEISIGTYEYQVRVPGDLEDYKLINDIVLNPAAQDPVYIKDVAKVSFGIKEPTTISRLNGRDSVTLSVKKRSGENIIRIAEQIHQIVEDAKPGFPEGTEVAVVADQSTDIKHMVNELENNILSGLILVIAVLLIFLGFTNSLFVGLAIPFSMLISFVVLQAFGITLNMVVLFSLILALGMLVDNAIVIVENIYRHRHLGKDEIEAAAFGTHEVGGAVTASTITTLCAFAPLAFWPGIMGEFMRYLPITVIITLSASLLVALIFNPVLCARFMRVDTSKKKVRLGDRLLDWGLSTYEPTLRWALDHRGLSMIGMSLLFLAVLVAFGIFNAGTELFPDTDPTLAYVDVNAPSGTRIELSDQYSRQIEKEIAKLPDLKAYITGVGVESSGFGDPSNAPANRSRLDMEFVRSEDRHGSSREYLERLRKSLKTFTGAKLTIDKQEEGPPTGPPVDVQIQGDDFATLSDLSKQIQELIADIPGLVDLHDDLDRGRPEILIVPDLDRAARYGLRTFDIASTVQTAIKGVEVSKYRHGEDEYEIVVRYNPPSRSNLERLEDLTVFYEGQSIPLTAFARVTYSSGVSQIQRIGGQRVVNVLGEAATGTNAIALLSEVQRRVSQIDLPEGYSIVYKGQNEDQEESTAFLSKAFLIALMLIFIVLITQFDSVTVPLVIMASVIFSLMGVFLGLMFTHTSFGIIMTGVGVISLAGIVVNNAIVLLDYVIQLRHRGLDKHEALIEAGKTRFRPVILTAVTTILGLIPLTTGFSLDFDQLLSGHLNRAIVLGGESSQWWGPMGVAVIWGLSVATFLTLVIVPVMYSSLDPVKGTLRLLLFDWWRPSKRESA